MLFRLFLSTLIITACSSGDTDTQEPRVGTLPVKATTSFSASSSSGAKGNTALMLNDKYNQILEISIEPFELKEKHQIPGNVNAESLLAGPDGKYFLIVGRENYAIIHADGTSEVNPVDIFGKLRAAAFDGENGRLVIQDSFDSVGLIQLDEDGYVTDSWVGGPLLDNDGAIESGTILPGGPLLLARNDGQVAVVDFDESISDQDWSFDLMSWASDADESGEEEGEEENNTVSDNPITWMSPVGDSRHVIARTDTQVLLFDTQERTLLEQATPEMIIAHFDQAVGHVISKEIGSALYKVFWADGSELKSQLVKLRGSEGVDVTRVEYLSILNPKKDSLSITYGPNGNYETVYRVRLSDSRMVSVNDTPFRTKTTGQGYIYSTERRKAELAISANHLIYLHYNTLGKVERRKLGKSGEALLIKGFNLEDAQQNW